MPPGERFRGSSVKAPTSSTGPGSRFSGSTTSRESSVSSGPGSRFRSGGTAPDTFGGLPQTDNGGWQVRESLESAVTGFIPGVYHLATDPIKTSKQIAEGTYDYWKPAVSGYKDLLTGDIEGYKRGKSEFEKGVHENPLGLLDLYFGAGTVAGRTIALSNLKSLGRAPTAKEVRAAAIMGRNAGALRTINVRAAEGGETIPTRTIPKSAIRGARIEKTDQLLKTLSPNFPVVGEYRRAQRAAKNQDRVTYLKDVSSPEFQEYQQSFQKLNKIQRAAFSALARIPLAKDLQAWKEMLITADTPEGLQMVKLLDNQKVMSAYLNPSPKLLDAVEKGRKVSLLREDILLKKAALTGEESYLAPYRHMRTVRGAEILTKGVAYKNMRAIKAALTQIQNSKGKLAREGRKAGQADVRTAIKEGRAASAEGIKASAQRGRLFETAATADALYQRTNDLYTQVSEISRGEIDLNTLNDLGLTPEKYVPGVEKLPTRFASQTAEERVSQLRNAGVTPDLVDRIVASEQEITALKKQIKAEPKSKALKNKLASRVKAQENLHRQAATPSGTTNFDLAGMRIEALGVLYDRLQKATKQFERALVAETRLERETTRGLEAAEAQAKSKKDLDAAREKRMTILQGQRAKFADLLEKQYRLLDLQDELEDYRGKLYGGGKVEDLKEEIQAAGRPEPFYLPDVAALKTPARYAAPEGSVTVQRRRADIHDSKSILFRTGMLALHPDVLSPSFLRAAKHDYYTDLHDTTVRLAVEIPRGQGLPEGMEWVRKRRGEKIPYTETFKQEHLKEMQDVYGEDLAETQGFTHVTSDGKPDRTPDPSQVATRNRNRLAISSAYMDGFRADFTRTDTMLRKWVEAPLTVWRALILHLRVPWLLNNIMGNAMLTTLKIMGPNGLRAAAAMIYETKGMAGIRQMLKDESTRSLKPEDMARILPGQLRGVGIETQLPGKIPGIPEQAANKLDKAGRGVLGFLPKIDKKTEQAMRRLTANTILRGSDEVKARYAAMPKETRSWRRAASKELETNPELRNLVTKEINDALGDFLSLSRKERSLVRQVIPFYAWMREITRIAGKLALDHPGKASLIVKIGQVGSEMNQQDVPSYMRGIIPFGTTDEGNTQGLALHASNPFSTVTDLMRSGKALGPGSTEEERNAFLSDFNPFLAAIVRQYALGDSKYGLPTQAFLDTIKALPQARAILNPPSTLYPERDRKDLILQLLGDYRRTYDPDVASSYNFQGK